LNGLRNYANLSKLVNFEENYMHIDEDKKFDRRNIMLNLKNGIISQKDYEIFLLKLPDASDKLFNPEETLADSGEIGSKKEDEIYTKKKGARKKVKGK
jgi:hypothetical protein